MPKFKDNIKTEDRWALVGFMRATNESYVQEVAKEKPKSAFEGGEVKLTLNFGKESKTVDASSS